LRKKAVQEIPFKEGSLPFVVDKVLDLTPSIRSEVYKQFIGRKMRLVDLPIELRFKLISNGMRDIDPKIREQCKEYLKT